MILADTSVIIDFWKNPTQEKKQAFLKEQVAICGIISAELIHGANNEWDLQRIIDAVADFLYLPLHEDSWIETGKLLFLLKKRGMSVPFQDVVIAILSVRYSCKLWTLDTHFEVIRSVHTQLDLFKP